MNQNSDILDLQLNRNSLGIQLEQLRKDKKFTDVQLQIRDKLFHAHRAVISLHSPVLTAMISDQWSPNRICEISEDYVDPDIVEDLLSFLYTGRIKLTPDNTHPVCVAAHFLQIPSLLEPSVEHLCKLITVENVIELFKFSFQLERLRSACLQFIMGHHEKVFQTPEILELPVKDFKDLIILLKEQSWGTILRLSTFHCVARWTENLLSERLEHLQILLENIPLEELPYKALTQIILVNPLLEESTSGQKVVNDVIDKYQNWRADKQKLVFIGDPDSDENQSIECYDLQTEVSKKLPSMGRIKTDIRATILSHQNIIVVGQIDLGLKIISISFFNWKTKTWKELVKTAILQELSIGLFEDKLFLAGVSHNGPSVMCYSSESDELLRYPSPTIPLINGHLLEYKDHLYAIGGEKNTFERFDSSKFTWKMLGAKQSAQTFAVTIHLDQIYACGECGLEVYDPEANIWIVLAELLFDSDISLVSINGKLLTFGGRISNEMLKSGSPIYEFDTWSKQWVKFGTLPSSFVHHTALVGDFY